MPLHITHTQKSTIGRTHPIIRMFALLSRLSPALAAMLAERLFVTSLRSRPPGRESAWAASARRDEVLSSHGVLPVWVWGDGPRTVVLVHVWAGRGLQLGALAAPLVAAGFRVVAYDAPAHGLAPGRWSNLFRHTDGLTAVAKAYGPLTGVVAHSLGCSAVLLAAARNDLITERLVLFAPAAHTTTLTDWFGLMSGFSRAVVERMRRRLERRFDFEWADVEPWRLATEFDGDCLIVHDRHDHEIPWDEGHGLTRSLAHAHLVTTDGLGHRRILRDPGAVDAATDFLAGKEHLITDLSTAFPESQTQTAA